MFFGKGVLKIYSKSTGEHPCWSATSIKLQSNFNEITVRHGCSPVNLLHIFRIPFLKNTSGGILQPLNDNLQQSFGQKSNRLTYHPSTYEIPSYYKVQFLWCTLLWTHVNNVWPLELVLRMKFFHSLQSFISYIVNIVLWKYVFTRVVIKIKNFYPRRNLVAVMLRLCHSCCTFVALVLHFCRIRVALLLHSCCSCRAHDAHVWHSCCKID